MVWTDKFSYLLEINPSQLLYVAFAFLILLVIIVVITVLEKKLRKKYLLDKSNRNTFYKNQVKALMRSREEPEKIIDSINLLARDFFKEAFDLPYNLEYSEIMAELRKRGKKEAVSFTKIMEDASYSGEKIDKGKIHALIRLLNNIVTKNKIHIDEEKILKQKTKKK